MFNFFQQKNLYLHVPEGATPKEGSSAGIAIVFAFVSAFTKKPIKSALAMTGEIISGLMPIVIGMLYLDIFYINLFLLSPLFNKVIDPLLKPSTIIRI